LIPDTRGVFCGITRKTPLKHHPCTWGPYRRNQVPPLFKTFGDRRILQRTPDEDPADIMIGVYCGSRTYRFDDIEILPLEGFLNALFCGVVFSGSSS
jgi:hypothetical protein